MTPLRAPLRGCGYGRLKPCASSCPRWWVGHRHGERKRLGSAQHGAMWAWEPVLRVTSTTTAREARASVHIGESGRDSSLGLIVSLSGTDQIQWLPQAWGLRPHLC